MELKWTGIGGKFVLNTVAVVLAGIGDRWDVATEEEEVHSNSS